MKKKNKKTDAITALNPQNLLQKELNVNDTDDTPLTWIRFFLKN